MELIKKLYEDDNIKAECSLLEEYMENYDQTNEPLPTKILCEFLICLGCGYKVWEGYFSVCAPGEINLLKLCIMIKLGLMCKEDSFYLE